MAQVSKDLLVSVTKDELWVDVADDAEILGELPGDAPVAAAPECNVSKFEHQEFPEMSVSAYAADENSLERLLRDAARESARSSKAASHKSVQSSSGGSTKSVSSPITVEPPLIQCINQAGFLPFGVGARLIGESGKVPLDAQASDGAGVDWVSNWSSRPEMQPPPDWLMRLRHPSHPIGIAELSDIAAVTKRRFTLAPTLLTHALVFVLGAATMFLFLKKYLRWAPSGRSMVEIAGFSVS